MDRKRPTSGRSLVERAPSTVTNKHRATANGYVKMSETPKKSPVESVRRRELLSRLANVDTNFTGPCSGSSLRQPRPGRSGDAGYSERPRDPVSADGRSHP